jgi:hypothetical protein
MPVQACLLLDTVTTASAIALNGQSASVGGLQVDPRIVDNPIANNVVGLGDITGDVVGRAYQPARILNDPLYATFHPLLSGQLIYHIDSDALFLPQPEV